MNGCMKPLIFQNANTKVLQGKNSSNLSVSILKKKMISYIHSDLIWPLVTQACRSKKPPPPADFDRLFNPISNRKGRLCPPYYCLPPPPPLGLLDLPTALLLSHITWHLHNFKYSRLNKQSWSNKNVQNKTSYKPGIKMC